MNGVAELWVYLSATPLFGLTATLAVYLTAQAVYQRLGQAPLANPVLWSVLVLGGGLAMSGTPYSTYFAGAQFIHFLLGPAVVALAWPLWQRRAELRRRAGPLLAAALAGGTAVYDTSRLGRCLRDAHIVTQHIQTAPKLNETIGKLLLGLDVDTSMF